MGFAQPHILKLHEPAHNNGERENSGRHDLIVVANEFHLLSHSKFIAFVQQERAGEWNQFIIILLHDLNERGNELKLTLKFDCNNTN